MHPAFCVCRTLAGLFRVCFLLFNNIHCYGFLSFWTHSTPMMDFINRLFFCFNLCCSLLRHKYSQSPLGIIYLSELSAIWFKLYSVYISVNINLYGGHLIFITDLSLFWTLYLNERSLHFHHHGSVREKLKILKGFDPLRRTESISWKRVQREAWHLVTLWDIFRCFREPQWLLVFPALSVKENVWLW